ncbi:DoxX family membrane protein [Effusibacillus lacus]|uniref:Crp/Fnr family transcriptional regulator n=1 Tax=Effusibacillus lacus TaxID=1348429 RepID=A0A292YLN7_9BACL|nr:DoxX family membrane protein [Effusibacillus lacus]TCS70798.1 thiosulfate dehydrogenase [quinone] large subunit [Effusibacillus lacus]GAX89405.1 Crp/Fnr family transcriptional regulator [Effusibacillus lacus]
MLNWLRTNVYASVVLALLRIYLGWEWMSAGWHKLAGDKPFDASKFLQNAVNKPVLETGTTEALYPNYVAFLKSFALPNVDLFNFLIPWGEFLVGLGLLLGTLTTAAAFFGMVMNFAFMFAGTVSSNPFMALLGFFILAAGFNAGRFGGDYWVVPWMRGLAKRIFKKDKDVPGAKPHLPAV